VPSHRQKTRPRLSRLRALSLSALTLAVGGSALLGAQFGQAHPDAATNAAADAARARQVADRNFARTAPSASPSPSASAAPSPSARPSASRPAPHRTVVSKPARPAIPAGCQGYSGNQLIACKLLPAYGFSTGQMRSLVQLWNGESGWNTAATNPDSGAYGIPQALPASKLASAGANWRYSAETQIRWGLAYIRDSYGTPDNAWYTWSSRYPHWY
jgi:hypothetical protein